MTEPTVQPRDWSVAVQVLGRKTHRQVTIGPDPLHDDFVALSDASGEIVARYQRSSVIAMVIEPPEEQQARQA